MVEDVAVFWSKHANAPIQVAEYALVYMIAVDVMTMRCVTVTFAFTYLGEELVLGTATDNISVFMFSIFVLAGYCEHL